MYNITRGKLAGGVSVGAMSLVTQNLEAWGVYAGIPAKRIKERNRAILELEKNFLAQQDKDKCYII